MEGYPSARCSNGMNVILFPEMERTLTRIGLNWTTAASRQEFAIGDPEEAEDEVSSSENEEEEGMSPYSRQQKGGNSKSKSKGICLACQEAELEFAFPNCAHGGICKNCKDEDENVREAGNFKCPECGARSRHVIPV